MENGKKFPASAVGFLGDVGGELKKVVWPTPARTGKLTAVVLAMVITISLFLYALDLGFHAGMEAILR